MAELREKSFVVKYRYCNIPEKLQMFQAIGMKPGENSANLEYSTFAQGIDYVGFLIEEVSVKHEGEIISTWEDLLNCEDMMPQVIKIYSDILNPPKKKKAKKQ